VSWSLCNHHFVDGFGAMGDAVVCLRCGLDRYPEALPPGALWLAKALGRYTPETAPDHAERRLEAVAARARREGSA
jgi:hypothetical protein